MKNNTKEIIITVLIVLISLLLLNPFDFWMPNMMISLILIVTLVLFGFFASFILREKVIDERDGTHRTLAGRNAFLIGSGVILVGILVQAYQHNVDTWLVVALIVMIITKISSRIWSDKNL